MLDLNHVLATPGLDAQYFQGPSAWGQYLLISVSALATGGVLTVASGNWYVGQAIQFGGTIISGSITGYTPQAIYYIITVTSSTSITISASPGGAAVTSTASTGAPGITGTSLVPLFQSWSKPRGVKWIYMLGVGGGASGGTGVNTGITGGGGAGGGSGSQTVVMIPAMFVPDVLYIACGAGGGISPAITSGLPGLNGTPTYISIEANSNGLDFNKNLLWANPGNIGGSAASTGTIGTPGTAASAPTIAYMPLAGRGFYNFLAGQAGTGGGAGTAGVALTPPITGLMVTGGTSGGLSNGTSAAPGGAINAVGSALGSDFFPAIAGGVTATTAPTSGGIGSNFITRNFMMNYGGTGGGAAFNTAGATAGAGAAGSPGCGGGGAGGSNTTNTTLASPGAGGPGFVLILSW